MKGNVMRTVFFMNAAFWICACTIWAGHAASAQNRFSSNQYTSSVLYVEVKDDNDRRISTGSAVVVQKKKSGSATTYTLATAKHVVYVHGRLSPLTTINVFKTDSLYYPKSNTTNSFQAERVTSPLELSQCDVSPSKSLPSFCSYDIALFDITVNQPNLFEVLPFERALPKENVGVTLSGFPSGLYVESQAIITGVLEIDGLDFENYTGGETIVTNKSVKAGHSGGGVLQKSKLVGIVTKSSSSYSMTRSVSVRQLCEIWGNNRLSFACTGFPNIATSTVSRVPSNIPNSNLTKSTKNLIKPIPQNHPAIVTIVQNNKTVGYGVIFRQQKNNFYIATTASFQSSKDADITTLKRGRKNPLIRTNKNVLLASVREVHKISIGSTPLTILLVSTRASLTVASFCTAAQNASRTNSKHPCITHVPGKTLSDSQIRHHELCRLYSDVCKNNNGL
jgi:hypothetical protein